MLENYDLSKMANNQNEVQGLLVETCLKAYSERAKWIADPSFIRFPSEFISKEHTIEILDSPKFFAQKGKSI